MEKSPSNNPKKGKQIDIGQLLKAHPTQVPRTARGTAREGAVQSDGVAPIDWKQLFCMFGVIAVLVILAYANSLFAHPVFNDSSTLSFISTINNWDVFWTGLWGDAFASPLSQQWLKATYAWDYGAAAYGWWWYHTVNIGLHLFTCLYLFIFLFCLSRKLQRQHRLHINPYHVAFVATALFAVHPLASESVAYISGRVAPLLAINYFLALDCFLLGYLVRGAAAKFWGYCLAALFTCIGLLVSPDALTIPLSMLFVAALLKHPDESWLGWAAGHAVLLAVLVLSLGTLPYLLLKGAMLQAGNGVGLAILPGALYWPSQVKALLTYYLRCFVVPFGMVVDPPFVLAKGWLDPLSIAGMLVAAACLFGLWYLRKTPLLVLGLFLFLVGFIPASLIPQPELVADHRCYFSLSGLCLLAAYGLVWLSARSFKRVAIAVIAILVVLAGLTIWRNTVWMSNETLWQSTLQVNPGSARAHAMLALERLRLNQISSAAIEARKSIALDSRCVPGFVAVGETLLASKDYTGALDSFKNALDLAQKQAVNSDLVHIAQSGIAECLFNLGDYPSAVAAAEQAMQTNPVDAGLRVIAGRCFLALKKPDKALMELEIAARLDQHLPSIWEPLAEAALEMNTPSVAYQAAEIFNRIDNSSRAKILMARAAAANNKPDESMKLLEALQKTNPDDAQVFALSSLVEKRLGHSDKAEQYRVKAVSVDKDIFAKVRLQADSKHSIAPFD